MREKIFPFIGRLEKVGSADILLAYEQTRKQILSKWLCRCIILYSPAYNNDWTLKYATEHTNENSQQGYKGRIQVFGEA